MKIWVILVGWSRSSVLVTLSRLLALRVVTNPIMWPYTPGLAYISAKGLLMTLSPYGAQALHATSFSPTVANKLSPFPCHP